VASKKARAEHKTHTWAQAKQPTRPSTHLSVSSATGDALDPEARGVFFRPEGGRSAPPGPELARGDRNPELGRAGTEEELPRPLPGSE
jgi:hypothetical protein